MADLRDPMQDVFNAAEAIALALHHQRAMEDALTEMLDLPLAQAPDRGRKAFAALEAVRLFRAAAEAEVARLYAVSMGGPP